MSVTQVLDAVAYVLGTATIPLLAAAIALQARRGSQPYRRSVGAWLCIAVVVAMIAVSLVAWSRSGVPLQYSWWSVATLALAAVLLRRDERFWLGAAVLIVLYTVIGLISIAGFKYNFDSDTTGWRGTRLLVSWAGPNANPSAPDFGAASLHLAIARYGVPLAATVALGWTLARGQAATRVEQLALMAASGAFLADTVVGATLSAITFAAGGINGLPIGLTAAGIAASVVLLFTVGPGAFLGIVSGAKGLLGAKGHLETIDTLRSSLGVGGDDGTEFEDSGSAMGSLFRFLRGEVGWLQKVNLVLIALAGLGLFVLSLLTRAVSGDDNRTEISYEFVDREIALDERVERVLGGVDGVMWLVQPENRLAHFNPSDERLEVLDTPIADAMIEPGTDGGADGVGTIVAVTAESTPRLVTVEPDGTLVERMAFEAGTELRMAATDSRLFVAQTTGRVVAFENGEVVLDQSGDPLEVIVGFDEQLWTLHNAGEDRHDERVEFLAAERDPQTLEMVTANPASKSNDGYIWDNRYVYLPRARSMANINGDISVGPWVYGYMGRSDFIGLLESSRYYFHYDHVLGHVEGADSTWFVADDWRGIALTPRAEPTSYLARWVRGED